MSKDTSKTNLVDELEKLQRENRFLKNTVSNLEQEKEQILNAKNSDTQRYEIIKKFFYGDGIQTFLNHAGLGTELLLDDLVEMLTFLGEIKNYLPILEQSHSMELSKELEGHMTTLKEINTIASNFPNEIEALKPNKYNLHREIISYSEFMDDITSGMSDILREKRPDLELILNLPENDVKLEINPEHLKNVHYALFENAARAMRDGQIIIDVTHITFNSRLEGHQEKVKTSYIDTGIGMTHTDIFVPYDGARKNIQKGGCASKHSIEYNKWGMTGYELHRSKQILDIYRGKICVEHTELGGGSTVGFLLPVYLEKENKTKE